MSTIRDPHAAENFLGVIRVYDTGSVPSVMAVGGTSNVHSEGFPCGDVNLGFTRVHLSGTAALFEEKIG